MQRHYKQDVHSLDLVHNYKEEQRRRKLTVLLKNAILQVWLEVREKRSTPNMEEVIKSLSEKSKQQRDPNYVENLKQQRKERRERERREYQERMNAHLSQYINREQFEYFDENLKEINQKISEHSEQVDAIELKLLAIQKARQHRRKLKQQAAEQSTTLKPGEKVAGSKGGSSPRASKQSKAELGKAGQSGAARQGKRGAAGGDAEEGPSQKVEDQLMKALKLKGARPSNGDQAVSPGRAGSARRSAAGTGFSIKVSQM